MNDALVSWTILIGSITIWFFFSLASILHATLAGGMTYFAIIGAATSNGPQGVGANDERIYYGIDLLTIAKYTSLAVFVIVLVWKEAKNDEQKLPPLPPSAPLPPSSPDKTRIETANTTWNTNTSNNAREDPFSNHNGHNNGGVEDNNNPRITLRWDDMKGFILKRATIAQRKVNRWSHFDSFDEDEVVNAVNNGVNNREERETVSMKMGDINIASVTLNDSIHASLVERINRIDENDE